MKKSLSCLLALGLLSSSAFGADTDYANAVVALSPTYYYELNETSADDPAVDTMGNAPLEAIYVGDYSDGEEGFPQVACPGPTIINDIPLDDPEFMNEYGYEPIPIPGVGDNSLAHCSNNVGFVELGDAEDYGASAITVSMFFRHGGFRGTGGDRLFTNNLSDPATSFQVNTAGEGLVVAVNPSASGELAERTLNIRGMGAEPAGDAGDRALIDEAYGWFHVVASTHGAASERAGNIQVWINGENRTEDLSITNWGWGIDTDFAKIGGRREDPADSTTHAGAQDEVAIWLDRVLTEEEVQSLWSAATGPLDPVCTPNETGDIDGNGEVDFADFLLLSGNFGTAGEGDLDCSGEVDFADFLTLAANFGQTVAATQSVPEPGTAGVLALGLLGCAALRRRRN